MRNGEPATSALAMKDVDPEVLRELASLLEGAAYAESMYQARQIWEMIHELVADYEDMLTSRTLTSKQPMTTDRLSRADEHKN